MPHRHSDEKTCERRLRAARLGYLRPTPSGFRHVLVPSFLQERTRAIVSSLTLHNEHDRLAGVQSHFARNATSAAWRKELINDCELGCAMASHRAANRAKHDLTTANRHRDPMQVDDPWAKFLRASSAGSSRTCVSTAASSLNVMSAAPAASLEVANWALVEPLTTPCTSSDDAPPRASSSADAATTGNPAVTTELGSPAAGRLSTSSSDETSASDSSSLATAAATPADQMCVCIGSLAQCSSFARSMGFGLPPGVAPVAPSRVLCSCGCCLSSWLDVGWRCPGSADYSFSGPATAKATTVGDGDGVLDAFVDIVLPGSLHGPGSGGDDCCNGDCVAAMGLASVGPSALGGRLTVGELVARLEPTMLHSGVVLSPVHSTSSKCERSWASLIEDSCRSSDSSTSSVATRPWRLVTSALPRVLHGPPRWAQF